MPAETINLPTRVPLVIEPENRSGSTDKDARLVNCYMEKKKSRDGETWIIKRPGLLEQSRPPGGNAAGLGVFNWRGSVYSVFGTTLYKDGVSVGTVSGTDGVYRFESTLGATPKLVLGNGVDAYTYDTTNGLVPITDPDFPATFRKGWAYLNGTLYVLRRDAGIQGSEINDPHSWEADNVVIAQIEPDQGVALAKQLVYVVVLKQWSTEIFYDAANAVGSPLGRVEGAKQSFGCISQDSVQSIDDMLFWLASSKSASRQIVRLAQLKLDPISTPAIERLLQDANLTTIYSWQLSRDGHRFYVLSLVEANITLAYDLDENSWTQFTDSDGAYMPIAAVTWTDDSKTILQHRTNGRLYYASSNYYTDDGAVIIADIITPNWDAGVESRGKAVKKLAIIADQESGSQIEIRTNDSDFAPAGWTKWREIDMSKKLPFVDDMGTFNRRSHWLRHQKPTALRLKAVEVQMDICAGPVDG